MKAPRARSLGTVRRGWMTCMLSLDGSGPHPARRWRKGHPLRRATPAHLARSARRETVQLWPLQAAACREPAQTADPCRRGRTWQRWHGSPPPAESCRTTASFARSLNQRVGGGGAVRGEVLACSPPSKRVACAYDCAGTWRRSASWRRNPTLTVAGTQAHMHTWVCQLVPQREHRYDCTQGLLQGPGNCRSETASFLTVGTEHNHVQIPVTLGTSDATQEALDSAATGHLGSPGQMCFCLMMGGSPSSPGVEAAPFPPVCALKGTVRFAPRPHRCYEEQGGMTGHRRENRGSCAATGADVTGDGQLLLLGCVGRRRFAQMTAP